MSKLKEHETLLKCQDGESRKHTDSPVHRYAFRAGPAAFYNKVQQNMTSYNVMHAASQGTTRSVQDLSKLNYTVHTNYYTNTQRDKITML